MDEMPLEAPVETPRDVSLHGLRVLRERFGHGQFRPFQAAAVDALYAGKDCVVLMPTGGGKSLCFQIPAVLFSEQGRGVTLVVSPLIALMADQVAALQRAGVRAAFLNSSQDELEQMRVEALFLTGRLDLLYVSPERLGAPSFQRMLPKVRVPAVVVDEAHCVSQWGHDFRPDYAAISQHVALLRRRQSVPMMALTASAPPAVLDDVVRLLALQDPTVLKGGFARLNLAYSVLHVQTQSQRMMFALDLLERHGFRGGTSRGRAILYAATRRCAEETAKTLRDHGVAATVYHAGLSDSARQKAQRAFVAGRAPVLVGTNAFGMGVDQPDVRLVIHVQAPGSLEAYYQESGRGGRDGQAAQCVLMLGLSDIRLHRILMRKGRVTPSFLQLREDALSALHAYAQDTQCRQAHLLRHFEGRPINMRCDVCDACTGTLRMRATPKTNACGATAPVVPLSAEEEALLLQAVGALRKPVGKALLARALRGSKAADVRRKGLMRLPQAGALMHCSEASVIGAMDGLLKDGRLVRKGVKYPTVWLAHRAVRATRPDGSLPRLSVRPGKAPLLQALLRWRKQQAHRLGWKPYMVFANATLRAISVSYPLTLDALDAIRGVGPARLERFGVEILQLVQKFVPSTARAG
jgi:ATP-dependent DNA helicase RecQ